MLIHSVHLFRHNSAVRKEPLTQRQDEAYDFIRRYVDEHERPPTMHEIGDALGISSTNGVYKLLGALEKKGWIERERHAARSIRLVADEQAPFGVGQGGRRLPVISRTASDSPERLRDRPQGTLSVDDQLLRHAVDPEACVFGRAGDDGMNEAGIHKGDLLLIEETDWRSADDGQIVAALVGEKLLARAFYLSDERIHLKPSNRHYTEGTYSPTGPDAYVIGPLRALIRAL